jgi:hypothetical protein
LVFRRVTLLVGFVLTAWPAAAQDHKFEFSINTGNARPRIVYAGPQFFRSPPRVIESAETHDLWLTGADARLYWKRRLSAVVQASFGNNPSRVFTFVQDSPPALGLPSKAVEQTVERRVWTFSLLQSMDLVPAGRVRPWVGAGIEFVNAVDRQHTVSISMSSPPTRSEETADLDRSGQAAVAAGGIRVYVTRWLFLSGEGSVRGYLGEIPLGSFNALWRAGMGIGF